MIMRQFVILLLVFFLTSSFVYADEKKGGIVLAFDDSVT